MSGKELKKGLSSREARLLSTLSSEGKRIISVADVQATLKYSYDNARRMVSDLMEKSWLERIAKGKYLIIPLEAGEKAIYTEHEFLIASELVNPYYIGFWSALNFHGLTEQVPFTVFVATTKRRSPVGIHNIKYRFVTLVKQRFFGFKEYSIAGKLARISDPEKTIVDSLSHPEYSGGVEEIAKALRNGEDTISPVRLIEYASRLRNGAVLKRLRYLLYITGYNPSPKLKNRIEKNLTTGFPILDPSGPAKGRYSRKWMLRLNIPEDRLKGENE